MLRHLYPAVFTIEDNGYSVRFPDFDGCFSEGDTLEETYEMAFDALGLYLDDNNKSFEYPPASNPKDIEIGDDEFVVMIDFNMNEYLKKHKNKSVRKTLTIPQWLNDMAIKENINFSNVLQNALIDLLQISK